MHRFDLFAISSLNVVEFSFKKGTQLITRSDALSKAERQKGDAYVCLKSVEFQFGGDILTFLLTAIGQVVEYYILYS